MGITWLALAGLVVWLVLAAQALAGPPPDSDPGTADAGAQLPDTGEVDPSTPREGEGSPEPQPSTAAPMNRAEEDAQLLRAKRLRERAQQLDALRRGELSLDVEVAPLFELNLADPPLEEAGPFGMRALLESVREARRLRADYEQARAEALNEGSARRREQALARLPPLELPPPPSVPSSDVASELERAEAELFSAYWRILTLPAEQRGALLDQHAARIAARREAEQADSQARARLEGLEADALALEALLAGTLDPQRDPEQLLRLGLVGVVEEPGDGRLRRMLGERESAPTPAEDPPSADRAADEQSESESEKGEGDEPAEPGSDASPEDEADPGTESSEASALERELAEAQARVDGLRLAFLALPTDERRSLLDDHRARREAAEREAAEQDTAARIVAAEEAQDALVEEAVNEAEDKAAAARREREEAERAREAARTSATQNIADERTRLARINEANSNYEVELQKHRRASGETDKVAGELVQRVEALAEQSPSPTREAQADALYEELREALETSRERFDESLGTLGPGQSGVSPVGEPRTSLPSRSEYPELIQDLSRLRTEVEASAEQLRQEEDEVLWNAARTGRDDIVMLNRARLLLLELASAELRTRMTGFGPEGVDQARREAKQIVLELRYRLVWIPRLGRTVLSDLERDPFTVLFKLLKLALVGLAFYYWRRRAEALFDDWREFFHQRERGNARLNAALAHAIWYLERIRRPLELLTAAWAVFAILRNGEGQGMLELEVVWLVLLWVLLGLTMILLVDSIALHENLLFGGSSTARADLRLRSLRLVGMTVVFSGLVLSLTVELVGEGAIYHWVGRLVWFAAIPVIAVLIRWWREPAFRRIHDDPEIPDNAFARWIRANNEGLTSFPAAALAGIYLFGRGLGRWLLHRATTFDATRSLLAWLFRREVARQANARREDEQPVRQLAVEEHPEFDPGLAVEVDELPPAMQAVAAELLEEIIALKVAHRGTLSAVLGERGSGKSTFLRRLEYELRERAEDYVHAESSLTRSGAGSEDEQSLVKSKRGSKAEEEASEAEPHEEYGRLTIRRIQCPPGGFRMLQRAIADSIGLSRHTSREELVAALSRQTPIVFLIDDAHRLVRPAIGGLRGLDEFADFAREVSGDASWITSIGSAAWQYVSRSRGERMFFDQVVELPRWDEQQIGELIRSRSRAAAIRASFDEIVIPQQFDVSALADLDADQRPSAEDRAERGYYRILWDYARGNPSVALHFWRESLCAIPAAGEERITVRLFNEPPAAALDEVGPTMHFVLRGVVQLEIASPEDLVACTQLPPADVADALRFALARGWVDRVGRRGERYRVTWHWYRPITNMLHRQHLLVM